MIAQNLLLLLLRAFSQAFIKPTERNIGYVRFKEDEVFLIMFTDGRIELLIGREEELVVGDSREKIKRIFIDICSDGLIYQFIAQYIWLVLHIYSQLFPHMCKMVKKSSLIGKKILLKPHHIIGSIKKAKLYLQAVLNDRNSILPLHFHFDGLGKRYMRSSPQREALPAVPSAQQILMSIQQHHNIMLVAHPDNLPQLLHIREVVQRRLGFHTLPCHIQPNHIKPPRLQVAEIVMSEGEVGGVLDQFGIVRWCFVDYIHPMIHPIPSKLIHQQCTVPVHSQRPYTHYQQTYHPYHIANYFVNVDKLLSQLLSTMENNDHDGKYGWICVVWTMGMILSSVCMLDTGKMNRLAMPVDSDGNVCGEDKPYLWVEAQYRTCQLDCVDEVMMELGGICLSEVNKYLLQMSGQWQQLVNKQLILQIYHAIFCSIFLSLLIALILLFLAYFIRPLPYLLIGINSIALLLLTYLLRDYYHLCVGLLLLGLAYYVYVVRVVLCQNTPSSPPPILQKPLIIPMLCSVGMMVLGVVIIILCLLEYMCMLSSQPLASSPSSIFSSINTFSYKEMIVIVHTYYLMHLLSCLHNYLIGGYYSTERQSLDMGRICGHFGSICKMAFIRSIFIVPISILYWWKASEGEPCAGCCHWTCGCLLNFSRRYSLPVLPYMYATNSVTGLSVSARHLSAEWHLQKQSATSSILPSSLSFLFFLLLALIFLPYLPKYQHLEHVAILAFLLMVIFGLWLCQFLHWVAHQHEGAQLRQVCQNNRKQLYT